MNIGTVLDTKELLKVHGAWTNCHWIRQINHSCKGRCAEGLNIYSVDGSKRHCKPKLLTHLNRTAAGKFLRLAFLYHIRGIT